MSTHKAMPSFFQKLLKKPGEELQMAVAAESKADITEPHRLLSAMNMPSPFAVSSEEQFTVRELSMLIPQKFVRQDAMPGDQPVSLPLDDLRASLQQGRPALRLSQIYLACPRLFTRQVLPAEDMEIVLPFQKVKRMADAGGTAAPASPFAAVAPPQSARMDSPFAALGSPFAPNGGPAQPAGTSPFSTARAVSESPFAVRTTDPAGQADVLSPSSVELAPPVEPAPPVNPFQQLAPPSALPLHPVQSPFQLVAPAVPPSPFFHASGQENGNGRAAPPLEEDSADGSDGPTSDPDDTHPVSQGASPFGMPGAVAVPPSAPARSQTTPIPSQPVLPSLLSVPPAHSPEPPGRLRVSLASLLRDVTAEDLGFDPSAVPGNVDADLCYDTILPQLATGRVEVSIEELRQGVVERFRPAFARVRPELRFVVPLSEIFQNLPSSAIPAPRLVEHVSISTTPFQTPFAIKADEDRTQSPLPSLSHLITPSAPEPALMAPFPVAPPMAAPKPGTTPVILPKLTPLPVVSAALAPPIPPNASGTSELPNISGMSARPSPFARPPGLQPPPARMAPPVTLPSLPSAESHDDLGQPFSAASLRAEPPVPATVPVPPAPFDPAKLFAGPAAPAANPAFPPAAKGSPVRTLPAAAQPAAGSAQPIEFQFGEAIDYNQTLLRAFFSSAGDLTPHEIVDHCAQLPGLRSCLAILPGSTIASGHGSGSEDVTHFTANAPRAFEYLTGLAESMGFEGNGSFTLRAASTLRTFIIESGVCLAVLHEKSAFAPGVREKLILTARALADMMD